MSLIQKNDLGIIAMNNKVISRMILDEILILSEFLIPCNKKGKIIKEGPSPFKEPLLDSIDITENKKGIKIRVYIISNSNHSISETADILTDKIERIYETFHIKKPERIDICIKGIMTDQLVKRNIEVSRKNVQ